MRVAWSRRDGRTKRIFVAFDSGYERSHPGVKTPGYYQNPSGIAVLKRTVKGRVR